MSEWIGFVGAQKTIVAHEVKFQLLGLDGVERIRTKCGHNIKVTATVPAGKVRRCGQCVSRNVISRRTPATALIQFDAEDTDEL